MSLLKKKCEYCKKKIKKGGEVLKNVKVPGFIGTRPKAFCCLEHASAYEREVEEHLKKPKQGGSCCG
jgi:hypothetical protein